MNKVIIIGNLTKDVELQTTTSGIAVARMTVAVQRKFQNADGEREADFINIVAWRKLAETCHKYLAKGRKCGIVGTIQTRSYDAQDGSKRYVTEVVAEELEFLSAKSQGEEGADGGSSQTELTPIDDDGDLPF